MSGSSDAALLDAHVGGDAEAFGELFRRHRDVLWAVALRTTGDPTEAEDALQDAMVSALRAAAGFEGRSAVRTWLYRIVVNAALDRLRRRSARPTDPLPEEEPPDASDRFTQLDSRLDLMAALQALAPGQRAAVVLVDVEGLPVSEVAQILDVAEGTVKSRCSRGRAQLASILSPRNPDAPRDVEGRGADGPPHDLPVTGGEQR